MVLKTNVAETELAPGALITFIQKGLEYIGIEENIDEVLIVVFVYYTYSCLLTYIYYTKYNIIYHIQDTCNYTLI